MGAPTALARKREATCNAILDATSQLIAEKGVDGFTMSEVAERGRINRALIYHYFRDRDNLIFETIRHIVHRYEEVPDSVGTDSQERSIRMHIAHPEIARFIFHCFLTGRPLPSLSQRLREVIEQLEQIKTASGSASGIDPTMGVVAGWLIQLSWSFARTEVARQLGISPEEADERLIAHMRAASDMVMRSLSGAQSGTPP